MAASNTAFTFCKFSTSLINDLAKQLILLHWGKIR